MNFTMIFKIFKKSNILNSGILQTLVYFLIVFGEPRLSLALPKENQVKSLPSNTIAQDNPSHRYSTDINKERPKFCNCLNHFPISLTGKIVTQISLGGDSGTPELLVNMKFIPDQIMKINTMIVSGHVDGEHNDVLKPNDLTPFDQINDEILSTRITSSIDEEKINRISTPSLFETESSKDEISTVQFESTTPITTSLMDKMIETISQNPETSIVQSSKVEATTRRWITGVEETTADTELSETSLFKGTEFPKTTKKDSQDKKMKKFTSEREKTTQRISKTTLRLTTPIIEVVKKKKKNETNSSNDSEKKEIDANITREKNLEATSPQTVESTTEKSTSTPECKIPSISDIDILKIAEAIKLLYGGTTSATTRTNLMNKSLNRQEKTSTTTTTVDQRPTTSAWYNLILKTVPTASKKKIGLAKISYR